MNQATPTETRHASPTCGMLSNRFILLAAVRRPRRSAWAAGTAGAAGAVLALFAASGSARADQPLWELGLGAAALQTPHYRGSDQQHAWLLPTPYFVYHGQILRSDRDGARAVLLDGERLDVDLSANGTPPTRGGENRARAGMPELGATLEIGPKMNLLLGRGSDWKLDLRVPLRAAFALGSHSGAIGWVSTPVVNLDAQWQGWNIGVSGGPLLGTRRFHAYFYDVAPAYATASRATYAAGGGLAGWGGTLSASRRIGDFWLAGFLRGDTLAGAVFEDSPLVRQRSNITWGLAASWIFKVSETRVADTR